MNKIKSHLQTKQVENRVDLYYIDKESCIKSKQI